MPKTKKARKMRYGRYVDFEVAKRSSRWMTHAPQRSKDRCDWLSWITLVTRFEEIDFANQKDQHAATACIDRFRSFQRMALFTLTVDTIFSTERQFVAQQLCLLFQSGGVPDDDKSDEATFWVFVAICGTSKPGRTRDLARKMWIPLSRHVGFYVQSLFSWTEKRIRTDCARLSFARQRWFWRLLLLLHGNMTMA